MTSENVTIFNDECRLALQRFQDMHKNEASGKRYKIAGVEHDLSPVQYLEEAPIVECSCGATLVLEEEPYVRFQKDASALVDNACVEAIYQSALVTLQDETFEKIRASANSNDMHFGLGMFLRNRFIYSGKPGLSGNSGFLVHPDDISGNVLDRLIAYVIPEFNEMPLRYGLLPIHLFPQLYGSYYAINGLPPVDECAKHYQLLVEADELSKQNPYDISEDEQYDSWKKWRDQVLDLRNSFVLKVANEVWSNSAQKMDISQETLERVSAECKGMIHEKIPLFLPLEIAYFADRATDIPSEGYRALDWMLDSLFIGEKILSRIISDFDIEAYISKRKGKDI